MFAYALMRPNIADCNSRFFCQDFKNRHKQTNRIYAGEISSRSVGDIEPPLALPRQQRARVIRQRPCRGPSQLRRAQTTD